MRLTVVEEELLRLWEEKNALTPEIVLESASPPTSPLHDSFTWSDAEAAHEYRLLEARNLIRAVTVKVVSEAPDGEINAYKVRRWVAASRANIPGLPSGHYVPAASLDGNARMVLLQRMQRELQALRHRYSGFAEFWRQLDQMQHEHGSGQDLAG